MASPDDLRDPNPFVAFRRYADAQAAAMFNSFSDPFRRPPHDGPDFQKAQEELWRRFERSYERATNPTRTQTERDTETSSKPPEVQGVRPGFGREIEDPLQEDTGPYSPQAIKMREESKRRQGLFGRILSALGKTDSEEESARVCGHYSNGYARQEHARAEEIGKRMDKCPEVQAMYAEQERSQERARVEEIGKRMDRCPGVQAMHAEQELADEIMRADTIGQRMDKCPGVKQMYAEQDAAEEASHRVSTCPWVQEQKQTDDSGEQHTPYGMSWSWGPWGCEMGSRRLRREISDDKDGDVDTRLEERTFGPWTLGPIHIGPMSMATSFPKDMEAEFQKAFDEMDKRRQEVIARIFDAHQESRSNEDRFVPVVQVDSDRRPDPRQYVPTELMKRDGFRGHVNWRQAFEDLIAAETGDVMLGGTPWSSAEHESDDSWRARLQDRGLLRPEDEWQALMLGFQQRQQEKPQTSQDAPHTELEFYDRVQQTKPQAEQAGDQRPSILSSVTTVETVQNPDGSTTTKRTLKRRFSDGRVEKDESNESTPAAAVAQPAPRAIEDKARPTMVDQMRNEKKEKGAWFWS